MKIWVVGDIHGHFDKFKLLEEKMRLSTHDRIFCVGDLINRGPKSAEVLDYFMKNKHCNSLIGNHDWAFILCAIAKTGPIHSEFQALGQDLRSSQWLAWLRNRDWIHKTKEDIWLVHAGLWPDWSLEEHLYHAGILKAFFLQASVQDLRELDYYLPRITEPTYRNHLEYYAFLMNVFTKSRYLEKNGMRWSMNLAEKCHPAQAQHLTPWYQVYPYGTAQVLFGHWSTLKGLREPSVIGLDTGCSWGGPLTAYCIQTKDFLSV